MKYTYEDITVKYCFVQWIYTNEKETIERFQVSTMNFLNAFIYFRCVCVSCMFVCAPHACLRPEETNRSHWIP